ncbi:inner membrane-spanning protein YciB [Tropicibacter naphthalenivorans]|uniref:Inner membrane-spanning protein YciB n=1 Tax=Tropicibacter naphthalenivorans TaxID=441103 RepID=A0A0P1G3P2_9RHOB|nr:Intracellular septation protein [Tropicibacter naphthalenivorans]SMC66072.1 intracellular septation protein [Tropicibacter naphthalenivorans]
MTKQISPGVKAALEYGPIIGFFAAYMWLKDRVFEIAGTEYQGFIVVTACFIPVFLLSMAAQWILTRHLSLMQIVTAVLIVVFGGLSVWLNDERFFKMKPTLIYLLFGGALAVGIMRGESWLEKVMEGMMPLRHEGWMLLTKRIMLFFFGLAALNEIIWRTQTTETWVYFKTFGLTAAIFLFFIFQGKLFKEYALEESDEPAE